MKTKRKTKRLMWSVVSAAALSAAVTQPAVAADDEEEGKRRYFAGQKLYKVEKFLEAAKEFEAGYAAAPRPAFLLNIGHSYRQAGELKKARANYELLLELEPDFAKRDEIEGHLADIEKQLKAASRPPKPDVPPTVDEDPMVEDEPVPDVPLTGTAGGGDFEYERPDVMIMREEDNPDKQKKVKPSIFTNTWFWVGAVVVVAGVTAGVFLLAPEEQQGCPGTLCLME